MQYTYKQAFDKVTEEYIKGNILPMNPEFCFCGTLSPDSNWGSIFLFKNTEYYPYTQEEYQRMEFALFSKKAGRCWHDIIDDYEEVLFNGMCAALEELKQIHIERGEIVDDELTLNKRNVNENSNKVLQPV